jgi:multidrug efflux pump subunit AcrA (membrane-fusion protein)
VQLPDGLPAPAQGEALLPGGARVALRLREAAPAVDPLGRTRRARYAAPDLPDAQPLGSVVSVRFAAPGSPAAAPLWQVPVGALDERGKGARVWRVSEGRPEPVPVTVVSVDERSATVSGPLQAGERVVALGTHLLKDGMTVRERSR